MQSFPMAETRTVTAFQMLPVEVAQLILSELIRPEDLYAAIRASRTFNNSFKVYRERILLRAIESSLHQLILMNIVGMSQAPNYSNLHYVPHRYEAALAPKNPPSKPITEERWLFCRRAAQSRLSQVFRTRHYYGLRVAERSWEARRDGEKDDPDYDAYRITRESSEGNIAKFKGTVDRVAEIYGALRTHMIRLYHTSHPPTGGEWTPGSGVWQKALMEGSLADQQRFLSGYLKQMMALTN